MIYNFQIGETVLIALQATGAVDSDFDGVELTAVLKSAPDGKSVPPLETPPTAEFECTFRPLSGATGPGWNLLLTATQSAGIAEGYYVTNGVITFPDGFVEKTDPLFLHFAVATQ